MPGWMASIDDLTAIRSLGIGFVLAAVNPNPLTAIRGSLVANNNIVMVVLFLVLGAKVLGDGLGAVD